MALNVNTANAQAGQLNNNITQLRSSRKQLLSYKSSVLDNWQGKEVAYITQSVDQVVSQIDTAIRELESLSADIKTAANQIRQEELAAEAAARARAQKQARINAAQSAYDQSREELAKLQEERDKLIDKFHRASLRQRINIAKDIERLTADIENAQKQCEEKYNLLRAAKM